METGWEGNLRWETVLPFCVLIIADHICIFWFSHFFLSFYLFLGTNTITRTFVVLTSDTVTRLTVRSQWILFLQVYAKAKECSDQISVEDFAILLAKHFTLSYKQVNSMFKLVNLNYMRAGILTPFRSVLVEVVNWICEKSGVVIWWEF